MPNEEKNIFRLFEFSLLFKAIHAVAELVGGFLIYLVGTSRIVALVTRLTQGELTEDPNDLLANFFLHSAQNFSIGVETFTILYLLIHGIINFIIVLGLWCNKKWSYPVGIGVTALFMIYQMYRLFLMFSSWLFVLTLFDLLIVWLIYHEYQLHLRKNNFAV